MAINDKFADEILSEDELDGVAGGTRLETYDDGNELYKRGLLSAKDAMESSKVREKLHELGYLGYKDNGGIMNGNIYTDKNGTMVGRDDFWKNFNAENGTKIIR